MVELIVHWLWIPFGNRSLIPLRGLSGFQGIGFQIPLRRLSGFRVPPGLVVPAHPLPVPVFRSFEVSMYKFFTFTYLDLIVLCCQIEWFFVS